MKAWQGSLLALALGLALCAGLELGLRLVPGLRPPPFTVALARAGGAELRTVNPDFARRFFPSRVGRTSLAGIRMAPGPYLEPRPPGVMRVVLVGGSTVQGFPHPRRLTAAAYLGSMLADAWPGRPVEVYNGGITALASFAV
ncbi:MAG: hypothetical protein ABIL09_01565, partial [Gemmatimonadota bacterium]